MAQNSRDKDKAEGDKKTMVELKQTHTGSEHARLTRLLSSVFACLSCCCYELLCVPSVRLSGQTSTEFKSLYLCVCASRMA